MKQKPKQPTTTTTAPKVEAARQAAPAARVTPVKGLVSFPAEHLLTPQTPLPPSRVEADEMHGFIPAGAGVDYPLTYPGVSQMSFSRPGDDAPLHPSLSHVVRPDGPPTAEPAPAPPPAPANIGDQRAFESSVRQGGTPDTPLVSAEMNRAQADMRSDGPPASERLRAIAPDLLTALDAAVAFLRAYPFGPTKPTILADLERVLANATRL